MVVVEEVQQMQELVEMQVLAVLVVVELGDQVQEHKLVLQVILLQQLLLKEMMVEMEFNNFQIMVVAEAVVLVQLVQMPLQLENQVVLVEQD